MRARCGVWTTSVLLCCGRVTAFGRRVALCVLGAALITAAGHSAGADPAEPPQPQFGWREVWAGADATRDVWLLYSGVTLAPWSNDIYSNGLRLRATGGYGQYHFTKGVNKTTPCGDAGQDACVRVNKSFDVTLTYTDALVGYQQRFGELTAKAFVGVTMIDHASAAPAAATRVQGLQTGVKGMLELWLNLGTNAWTSLDLSYTTAHDTGAARWRGGWRVLPTLSIGPEARYDSNAEDDAGRAGLFARYEWFGGEASLAAGASGTMTGGQAEGLEPYATFNLLFQY